MAENQTTREKTDGRGKKRAGLEGKPVISVAEAAEKWGISVRRANQLCQDGRVIGAFKLTPRLWVIPADAPKPDDNRISSKRKPRNHPIKAEESVDEK